MYAYALSVLHALCVANAQVNSLPLQRCGGDVKCENFKHNTGIDSLNIRVNIFLEFLQDSLFDNKSTLVQVMAWCRTGNKA